MVATRRTRQVQVLSLLFSLLLVFTVLAADGDLDPTFGTGGRVTTDYLGAPIGTGGHDRGSAIAIQGDGKLVVAGIADSDSFDPIVVIARYWPTGVLDTTFGAGGTGIVDVGFYWGYTPDEREGVDVAIQTDGKIVVGATVASGAPYSSPNDFGLARFNPNGTPDGTFGVGGKVTTDFGNIGDSFPTNDGITSIALQTDGSIVAAGFARVNGGFSDFALARYDTNGALDASFGAGGKVLIDYYGLDDWAGGVAIQTDGKIVAVGTAVEQVAAFTYRRYAATARVLGTNGVPDAGFAAGGLATLDISPTSEFGTFGNAVALQTDGKIVVGGTVFLNAPPNIFDFALIRYTSTGLLDSSFNSTGVVTTDFIGGIDIVRDLAIQSDGKIVAAGSRTESQSGSDLENKVDFALARYSDAGVLDTSFGSAATGKVNTDFDGSIDAAQGVAIQGDCRIVAAGYTWIILDSGSGPELRYDANIALARYDSGGCTPPPPPTACPLSQGYWKTHAATWPVASLSLGGTTYSKAELLALLQGPAVGDASLILAIQLIAAKLNAAAGADSTPVAATMAHADSLLAGFGGTLPYKVKASSAVGLLMTADAVVLEQYNTGLLTTGCPARN